MPNLIPNTFLITLFLLPGITWSLIWMKYSKTRPQTDKFYFSVYALVASVFCYGLVSFCFGIEKILAIFQQQSVSEDGVKIVFSAVVAAIFIGVISVWGSHKKWIVRVMQWCKITLRDGEDDLWCSSLYCHIKEKGSDAFIRIYDQKRDLIYSGVVHKISEEKFEKEIVLLNVKIYENPTGKLITELAKIYLVFDHREFFIEFLSTSKGV